MMMGIQEMLVALMFTVFGGTSGNEVLDYVDADLYFKSKGLEMSIESMMLEAKKPDVAAEASVKEASIRRLLAIRSLGDLKDKKALSVLNSFTNSEEMFVAAYAKLSIAKIEGKELPSKANSEHWKKDLPALPKNTGVVVSLKLNDLKSNAGLMTKLKTMMKKEGVDRDGMINDMEASITENFFPLLDKIGNIRIDSITIAIADNVGGNSGWVAGIINGEYDKQAMKKFINKEVAKNIELKKIEQTTYFMPTKTMAFACQDNHQFTFISGPDEKSMPLSEVQKAIDTKNQIITFSNKLQKLIEKTSKKGNMWAAGLVTGEMLNMPFIKEFRTVRIEMELKGNLSLASVIVEGKDEEIIEETMTNIENIYLKFKQDNLEDMMDNMPKIMRPIAKSFESLQFRNHDKEGVISVELPVISPLNLIFGAFMLAPVPEPVPVPRER